MVKGKVYLFIHFLINLSIIFLFSYSLFIVTNYAFPKPFFLNKTLKQIVNLIKLN